MNSPLATLDTRRQLLRLVLRQTLHDNGIPYGWIHAEALRALAAGREGIHLRFLVCEWHPQLLPYGPAFQREFKVRLLAIDPEARGWLMGMSWQYALPAGTPWPALPPAETWAALHGSTLDEEHAAMCLQPELLHEPAAAMKSPPRTQGA